MLKNSVFILISIVIAGFFSCNNKIQPEIENDLVDVINQYRIDNGLPAIPESESLNFVAEQHVYDLAENQPDKGECNMHSWSDKGSWTACCYTDDHAQAQCMWDKPRELTSYQGDGYEIASYSGENISGEEALSVWKTSEPHHDVILNKDIWEDMEWNAIGAATYKGYAVVWFGTEPDIQ